MPTSVLAFVIAVAVGWAIALVLGIYQLHAADFWSVWTGPRALILGLDPYDASTWPAMLAPFESLRHSPFTAVYAYPPATALALLPLGLLTFEAASIVWTIGGILVATAAVAALLRAYAPDDALLGAITGSGLTLSAPAITTIFNAQWGFLQTAALALAVLAVRRNSALAGLGAFVLLLKPQAFVLALPSLMLQARAAGAHRAFQGLLGAVAVIAVMTLAQPAALLSWYRWIPSYVADDAHVNPDATLTGVVVNVFSTHPTVTAAVVLLVAIAAVFLLRRRTADYFPASVALSLAAAPHGRSYDQLILLVVLVMAAATSERGARLVAILALTIFVVGSLLLYGVALVRHDELWSAALPLVVGALLAGSALLRERG